ncbi:hypothetical protein CBR_g29508 [Chara braunii]|uniref:Uncharacterized protein n=1 Tax=Chara braunii TaxID=69332 RepID=A0A388LAM0_CHABU|nr:hypothetical protein CBR_g29508 [Chara braunii]|eukprot:GBG79360.1 hypothetical protein CBR_g29508 [Chara braunii]
MSSEDKEVQSQVKEIGQSIAAMKEYIEADRAKKEAKIQKKAEKEAEKRAKEEKEAREKKARKKAEKAKLEEERLAAMRKDMDVHLKVTVKEAMNEACSEFRKAMIAAKLKEKMKGKRRVTYVSDEGEKRGPEPVFKDSPLMEGLAKRTPKQTPKRGILKPVKLTPRLTRSKTKPKVKVSPTVKERFASAVKRKIPARIGLVGRYMFRDEVMRQLKNYDTITLQNLCNDEGVPYNGKIDAIFDLVEHRTCDAYGTEDEGEGLGGEKRDNEEESTTEDTGGAEDIAE